MHAVRHVRPLRLVLDLGDVDRLDPINVGTLAAACDLGDDHQVAVFLDNSSTDIADELAAAGVASHRSGTSGEHPHSERRLSRCPAPPDPAQARRPPHANARNT